MEAEKLLETKRIVKRAMRGFMPDEKVRAWRAIENCMKLQELQQTIADTEPDIFELGEGSYTPEILIITETPVTKAEQTILSGILRAIGINEQDVYFTVDSTYADQEIKILQPVVMIRFGEDDAGYRNTIDTTIWGRPILHSYPLSYMLPDQPGFKEVKNDVWKSLKEIMARYDEAVKEKGR